MTPIFIAANMVSSKVWTVWVPNNWGHFFKRFAINWSVFKPALSRKFLISWNATLLHCGILPPICNRETDVITTAALLKRMHLVTVEVSCMGSFRWGTDKRQQHQPDWDNVHSVVMKTMEMCWWWWIWWWQEQINKYKTVFGWHTQFIIDMHPILEEADGRKADLRKCLRGQSLFWFSQSPKLASQEGRRGQMLDICKQLDNSGQVVDTNTSTDNGQDYGGATRGVFVTDSCI